MNSRKAGGLFLTLIVIYIGVSLWFSFGIPNITLEIIPNLLLSESLIIFPALLFLVVTRTNIRGVISFRKIKWSTTAYIILFTMLLSPLVTVANGISMLFTENVVMEISEEILKTPYPIVILIMGIMGPFCEEIAYRGIIYGTLKKTDRILGAVILSSVLFGLMHMNFNQLFYAVVLGIPLCLLVEVTDSIWSGFIAHATVNIGNMTLLYLTAPLLKKFEGMGGSMNEMYSQKELLITICVYAVIAVITTTLAICVFIKLVENEGKTTAMIQLFKKRIHTGLELEPRESLFSVPLVLGMLIALGFMVIMEVLV